MTAKKTGTEDWHNFGSRALAPDHLLRNWAESIAVVWAAMEPTDKKVKEQDLRNDEVHGKALGLLNDFCLRVALDKPQSQETLRWLAEAVQRVVDYKDPLHAFGLLPRPNRRPANAQPAIDVAWWLACAGQLGYSNPEANALAAECFCKDLKTVQGHRRRAGGWTTEMNPDLQHWKQYFDHHCRPLPAAALPGRGRSRRVK